MSSGCFSNAAGIVLGYFGDALKMFRGCLRDVFRMFWGCFGGVLFGFWRGFGFGEMLATLDGCLLGAGSGTGSPADWPICSHLARNFSMYILNVGIPVLD